MSIEIDANPSSVKVKDKKITPHTHFIYSVLATQTVHPFAYPLDTIDKRLQASEKKIFTPKNTFKSMYDDLKKIAFANANDKNTLEKLKSVYQGFLPAAFYKIPQRGLKFWGQPYIKNYLDNYYGDYFNKQYNKKEKEVLLNTAGGAVMALLETVFLTPFDKWKVINQVGNTKINLYKGLLDSVTTKPYAGILAIGLRNLTGNMALFFGSTLIKEYVMNLEKPEKATFKENLIASGLAATSSVFLTNPWDTIKTRAQKANGAKSSVSIFKNMLKNEGWKAFYKGTGPRIVTAGPQLGVTMALAQSLPNMVEETKEYFKSKKYF